MFVSVPAVITYRGVCAVRDDISNIPTIKQFAVL